MKIKIEIPKNIKNNAPAASPAPAPTVPSNPAPAAPSAFAPKAPETKNITTTETLKQNSVFDNNVDDKKGLEDYNDFIETKKGVGIKTTKLRDGEVNFAEYGAALSEELKQQIIDSFDCEADYVLQQEIAGLFSRDNDLSFDDFVHALKDMGYEVSRESVRTSYIIDDKKSAANGGGQLTEGNISVFTITDATTGAEIKIADTNGNGAIESEEVFMNELLTGIAKDIDISNIDKFKGVAVSHGAKDALLSSLDSEGNLNYEEYKKKIEDTHTKGELKKERYDKVLEAVVAKIKSLNIVKTDAQAELLAKQYMNANYDTVEEKNIKTSLIDSAAITAFVKNNPISKQNLKAEEKQNQMIYETIDDLMEDKEEYITNK